MAIKTPLPQIHVMLAADGRWSVVREGRQPAVWPSRRAAIAAAVHQAMHQNVALQIHPTPAPPASHADAWMDAGTLPDWESIQRQLQRPLGR